MRMTRSVDSVKVNAINCASEGSESVAEQTFTTPIFFFQKIVEE